MLAFTKNLKKSCCITGVGQERAAATEQQPSGLPIVADGYKWMMLHSQHGKRRQKSFILILILIYWQTTQRYPFLPQEVPQARLDGLWAAWPGGNNQPRTGVGSGWPLMSLPTQPLLDSGVHLRTEAAHVRTEPIFFSDSFSWSSLPPQSFGMQLGHICKQAYGRSWFPLFKTKNMHFHHLRSCSFLARGPSDPPASFYQHLQRKREL